MSPQHWPYLERRWDDVRFYQALIGQLIHDENRRDALFKLVRAVTISDRAERVFK